jgi:hypothetical protein
MHVAQKEHWIDCTNIQQLKHARGINLIYFCKVAGQEHLQAKFGFMFAREL